MQYERAGCFGAVGLETFVVSVWQCREGSFGHYWGKLGAILRHPRSILGTSWGLSGAYVADLWALRARIVDLRAISRLLGAMLWCLGVSSSDLEVSLGGFGRSREPLGATLGPS